MTYDCLTLGCPVALAALIPPRLGFAEAPRSDAGPCGVRSGPGGSERA